jgi:DNA-binding GntR family transcriptional regulator
MPRRDEAELLETDISTQASSVHDRLQDDILAGRLEPGKKLRLNELIEQYGAGNSPLREALNRLSSSGMVTREDNRGFRVQAASVSELEELIRTRCWLEEIALRESIANGDSAWEEKIVLAFHWLSQASSDDSADSEKKSAEWEEHHLGFHSALISGCKSSILVDFCTQLQRRTFRYRNLAEVLEYRDVHELEEHRKLQDAAIKRDAELAVSLIRKHYMVTMEILLTSKRFE